MSFDSNILSGSWALILGASSGFGEAVSIKFAKCGMNIIGVHLDRKSTFPNAERVKAQIEEQGCEALFFNVNAADTEKRAFVMDEVEKRLAGTDKKIHVLMHSLAFGALKPFVVGENVIEQSQLEMTLDVMANSLVYWTQDVVRRGLMNDGGRIFAMTSSGDQRVLPSYGAVSAAKSALESYIRQLAFELAPRKITANAIRAGITDTPALRKIPEAEDMIRRALAGNPSGRLTLPGDVADAIALLSHPDAYWITGNVISVDGGEMIVS